LGVGTTGQVGNEAAKAEFPKCRGSGSPPHSLAGLAMSDALFPEERDAQPQATLTGSAAAPAPVVLARKWRPRAFASVVGQDHVVRAMAHALDAGRLHHAYLLTGTRGTGKTTLARIIAKALNCDRGVSSTPCGVCGPCQQIDAGRFVDVIEIDAASNRGVGEIQQLLEQARFAPTSGRFKVYVIDEVHMLSNHAFNAMLKTLEEPPADVKFLLATTDPQKIPVTVLSRCLQFNLKNVPPETLCDHLASILVREHVDADSDALTWLAAAAQGSVRDALSLTDQAIAYGGGSVTSEAVRSMLGLVQSELLARLMQDLIEHRPAQAFATLDELCTSGASADALLADMARWFHMAATRAALAVETSDDPTGALALLADRMSADLLQLNYQIVTLGRRDLGLAPDERTGLEMTLLRLFAFQPAPASAPPSSLRASASASASISAPPTPTAARAVRTSSERVEPAARGDERAHAESPMPSVSLTPEQWPTLARSLRLSGLVGQFAQQAELISCDDQGRAVNCRFRVAIPALAEQAVLSRAQEALAAHFGKPCRVDIELGAPGAVTAAAQDARAAAQAQASAEATIQADPVVQSILQDFGGRIVPGSIRSTRKGNTP
jgi:DNA polymerase-3 subunit gamma/tau